MKRFVTTLHCIAMTLIYIHRAFQHARESRDPHKRWFPPLARQWAQALLRAANIRLTVTGAERLVSNQRYVYVANHASYMDIPVLLAALEDQIIIVYKHELEKVPFFGPMLKMSPFLPIERENPRKAFAAIRSALHLADQQWSLLLFPEGTRTSTGRMQPFKRGAFHLALQAGLPVVPVAVIGTYAILPRHRIGIQPNRTVTVIIGDPIEVPAQRTKAEERHILQQAEQTIRTLLQRHNPNVTQQVRATEELSR